MTYRLGYEDGYADALRHIITWLRERAESADDPQAKAFVSSATHDLGWSRLYENAFADPHDADDFVEKTTAIGHG